MVEITKPCTKCGHDLPLSAFGKHRMGKHGRQAACKACDSARAKAYLSSPANLARRKQTQAGWYAANRPRVQDKKAASYLTRRARHLVWSAANRAKRKGIPFRLGAADVVAIQARIDAGRCELTGTPFSLEPGKPNSPSIDRVDSSLGYTPENIRIVCHAMNAAMGDWGEGPVWEMFQHWAAKRGEPAAH